MRAGAELFPGLAALLHYPDGALRSRVGACRADLAAIVPAAAAELGPFAEAVTGTPLGVLQEQYTDAFDLDPRCALDVGWHLFGEACERGAFMAALREDLHRAGVPERGELPDHLTHVLALAAREEPERAATLTALVAPVIDTVQRALAARGSPYAGVLAALRDVVAAVGREAPQEVMPP